MSDLPAEFLAVDPNDGVIVAVSGGKDSIVALDVCRQHFKRVEAYHMYTVPGIEFIDKYLRFLERRYDVKINRRPGEQMSVKLREGLYRATCLDVPAITTTEIEADERRRTGIRWVATGMKKSDSLERRAMISSWGVVAEKQKKLFPIGEWSDAQVFSYLRKQGIVMPPDYSIWNTSWNYHMEGKQLAAIRERWPEDFARIVKFFPLCGAEADRWERHHGEEEKAGRDFTGFKKRTRKRRKPAAGGDGTSGEVDEVSNLHDAAGTPVGPEPGDLQPAHDRREQPTAAQEKPGA